MKKVIALSAVAFLATSAFADAGMQAKLDALMMKMELMEKAQQAKIDSLTTKITELEKRQSNPSLQTQITTTPTQDSEIKVLKEKIAKVEKKQASDSKRISKVNAQSAKDNIKFDVDFRTAYDNLQYKTVSGQKYSNDALYTSRLWLGMGYAPTDDMVFKGQLAYHKTFGQSAFRDDGYPQRGMGFDTFDWVSNETLTDDTLRVREAFWLWTPTIGDRGYTFSVGRRPSTNGFLANLKEDDANPKSPLAHVVNMEFDGASASVKLDDVLPGMMFKVCLGRGLTNAKAWANEADSTINNQSMASTSPNYIDDKDALDNVDMFGFIYVPYDDGQYSVKTTWLRGVKVPGMIMNDYSFGTDGTPGTADDTQTWAMDNVGDMDNMAISLKVDGIGNEINDFLDDTTFFVSYAVSKTHPENNSLRSAMATGAFGMMGADSGAMLGSNDSQTGTSIWLGANMPNLTGGRFGLEYNHGSKYWRPFTYGEDTLAGSKLATRGDAYEAYWTQPIIDDVFSMQIRYTYMKYDYTGSNGFFGDGGTPYSMADANANPNMDPVEKAQDIRAYFRYRY